MSGRTGDVGRGGAERLVGRDADFALLAECITAGVSVVVRGAAGVGKSALLDAALRPHSEVVRIRGTWALQSVPYLPLRRAMPSVASGLAPAALVSAIEARLVPSTVVAVDDLQWCDADTVSVLSELGMRRPLVVTSRPTADANTDALVERVAAEGKLIELEPLGMEAATDLARALRPAAPASDIRRWVAAARGNPLDLHLMALGTEGSAASAVSGLPEALLRDLARVAISGRPLELDATSSAQLERRGLVVMDGNGRAAPRHDEIATAVVSLVGAEARERIHLELARSSETPAELAIHLAAGGDARGAIAAATRAAATAPTVWSSAEFLRLAARQREPRDRDADLAAADALTLAGRYGEALELLDEGAPREYAEPRELLIRARAHWTLTEIDLAREDIRAGLAAPLTSDGQQAELLSLRSRIRCRVDWDLDGAIDDATRALELTHGHGTIGVAANSALGLARFIKGDASWQDALESAGRAAVRDADLHNAVTVYDTMIFGHLLAGDPARCVPLAAEMIEMTEQASAAWNGYFRAVGLLARLHVEGDYALLLDEAEQLARRRLSVKAQEALRTVRGLAMIDAGRELEAIEFAEESIARASDESARSMAGWVLTEALWIAGHAERALAAAEQARAPAVAGFPGAVNTALVGAWARRDLGRRIGEEVVNEVRSGFGNLAAAALELEGLGAASLGDAAGAQLAFGRAADAWTGISTRAALRARWAAAVSAFEAGDTEAARGLVQSLESANARLGIAWLDRRLAALTRDLDAASGEFRLDADERRVVELLSSGASLAETAESVGWSLKTVQRRVAALRRRVGVESNGEAVAIAARHLHADPDG